MLLENNYIPEPNTGCWLWLGSVNAEGYAQLSVTCRNTKSGVTTLKIHRVMYEQKHGAIPPDLKMDHKCRTPCCVNPDHVEPVTNAENVRRGNSSKLNLTQVERIRKSYSKRCISQLSLAIEYEVDESLIQKIVTGKAWVADVEQPLLTLNAKSGRRPKLSPFQVSDLLFEASRHECSQNQLARKYKVSAATVSKILKERN